MGGGDIIFGKMFRNITAPEEAIGIFDTAFLPRAVRVAKISGDPQFFFQKAVIIKFEAVVKSDRF